MFLLSEQPCPDNSIIRIQLFCVFGGIDPHPVGGSPFWAGAVVSYNNTVP